MAIDPSAEYPSQISLADPTGYPLGKAKNVVVAGDGTGTPFEQKWLNDVWGFLQQLLSAVAVEPSGTPDKVGASQYYDALETLRLADVAGAAIANNGARTPDNSYAGVFVGASAGYMFVIYGTLGAIQVSGDGITWTEVAPDGAYADTFHAAVWSGSLWCIVGEGGEIQTAPDPFTTWTNRTPAAAYSDDFFGVCFGAALFCAVGQSGEIQTSPDGITWTHRTAAAAYADTFLDVCFGGGLFVAVGQNGEIQTSPDGVTWTHRSADGSYTGDFRAVAHNGDKFVAVGQAGEIQSSPDGITWTTRTPALGLTGDWGDVTTVGRCFVIAASAGGAIQISPGGHDWRAIEAKQNINGIVVARQFSGDTIAEGAYTAVMVRGGVTGIRSSLFF